MNRYRHRRRPRYGHLLCYFATYDPHVSEAPSAKFPVADRTLERIPSPPPGMAFTLAFPSRWRQLQAGSDEHHWLPLASDVLDSIDHLLELRLDNPTNKKNLDDACDLAPAPVSNVADP